MKNKSHLWRIIANTIIKDVNKGISLLFEYKQFDSFIDTGARYVPFVFERLLLEKHTYEELEEEKMYRVKCEIEAYVAFMKVFERFKPHLICPRIKGLFWEQDSKNVLGYVPTAAFISKDYTTKSFYVSDSDFRYEEVEFLLKYRPELSDFLTIP